MSEADLIPFNKRSKAEHKMISSRGGTVRSKAKSDSAKWRHIKYRMKKKAMKDEDAKWLIKKLEDRAVMSGDMLITINELKQNIAPEQRIALLNAELQLAKFHHGEKIKTENVNVNINIDKEMNIEDIKAHIEKVK